MKGLRETDGCRERTPGEPFYNEANTQVKQPGEVSASGRTTNSAVPFLLR